MARIPRSSPKTGRWSRCSCPNRGLLFAALDPKESLLDQLGSLPAELADEPLETYAATDQATVSFAANWKIYTDNFVEGYHIPGTHPSFYAAIDFEAFQTTAHPVMSG
ncbi:hypothetical protein FJ960_12895 [Mesorhizobium sp. B2-3-11]|nr:hypothetical protein FJ960_12895 [Mesorhizobium sp. B2-3-11]